MTKQTPYFALRWVNQWDNLDGTIERGYGGRSIFWDNLHARADLSRVSDYGRLLASLGINGCSINNVNANPRSCARLHPADRAHRRGLPSLGRAGSRSRSTSAARKTIGGLDTFDPLDPQVTAWWKSTPTSSIRAVPDLAGFVMKADSEGAWVLRPMAARTPTPPTSWRARSSRTAV